MMPRTPGPGPDCVTRAALLCAGLVLCWLSPGASGSQSSVVGTVHNLSVSGPGEIKSRSETEVCRFCHIPHNAVVPQPLWGHALSEVREYQTPALRQGGGTRVPVPQPDGSSRLCLSCHDGTVALGEIAGKRGETDSLASERLTPDRRGYIGTDLTGGHPVSIVPQDDLSRDDPEREMGLRPLSTIVATGDARLDVEGKIQCTTCHDPHSDAHYVEGRVPRFWVKPTVSEVCLACHEPR